MILTKMAASLSIGLIKRAITKTTASSSTFISKAISPTNPISPMFGTICKHNRSFSTDDSNHDDDDDDDSHSYKPDPKKEWGAIITMYYPANSYLPRPFNVWEGVKDQMGHPFGKEKCASLYEIKRIKDGLYVRIDFPGLTSKDDVKITFKNDLAMIVKGEAGKYTETDSQGRSYEFRLHLAPGLYNTNNGIHVSVKDGVLRIVLPRIVKDDVSDEK